jgi:hypothetical protein
LPATAYQKFAKSSASDGFRFKVSILTKSQLAAFKIPSQVLRNSAMGRRWGSPSLYKYLLNCCDDRAKKPLLAPRLNSLRSNPTDFLTG